MRKAFCICVFIFCRCITYGQATLEKDSVFLQINQNKSEQVKSQKRIEYTSELILKKSPLATELQNFLIKDFTQKQDFPNLGKLHLSVGFAFLQLGEYAKAYANYLEAVSIFTKVNDPTNLTRAYQDLSWIQSQLSEFEKAEKSIQNALKVVQSNNLKGKEAEVWNFYGVLNDRQNKFEKAIECYKQALLLNEHDGTVYNKISSLLNLGISQRRLRLYDEAYKSLLKAREITEKENISYYKQAMLQNLADLSFDMEKFDEAEYYILESLKNSKGNLEIVLRRGLYENLVRIYRRKGAYNTALLYTDSVNIIAEQIFAKDKVTEVRNLQAKYETKLKDEQILKQELANQHQMQLLVLNQQKLELILSEKKNQELEYLQSQITTENRQKLQEAQIQKAKLETKLNKKISDQELALQHIELEESKRNELLFLLLSALALVVAALFFYNQFRTRKLNKVITQQKIDLEATNHVKDRMFSVIGHDLKSPINTLLAFNHLLEDPNLSVEKSKLYAAEIKSTLNNTANLMENLLEWSRSQMQGYKPLLKTHNLHQLVEEVIAESKPPYETKEITITNQIPINQEIFADDNMTSLVLRNLLSNAFKFTPSGGYITLKKGDNSQNISFLISDSGIGMSIEQVQKFNASENILNQSYKGTRQEKGTGLGLLLCKTFIHLMNGKISVASAPQKGTTFTIVLPACPV